MTDSELAWQARAATRLSQRAFARLIGAHPGTVAEWESGRGRMARLNRSLLHLIRAAPAFAEGILLGQGEHSNSLSKLGRAREGRAWCSPEATASSARGFAGPPSLPL